DSRIYELQEMIGRAQIIRDTHSSVVGPGSTIEVMADDGENETYHLVSAVESDPSAGRISVDSPVGRALVGKKKDDKITVCQPSGTLTLTIKAVKYRPRGRPPPPRSSIRSPSPIAPRS